MFPILFVMTVYYKMRQILLQNETAIFLQNATEVYYKMLQFYYKIRQLLQNAAFITNCGSTNSFSQAADLELRPALHFQ